MRLPDHSEHKMKTYLLLVVMCTLAGAAAAGAATENKGADQMVLDGGSRGSVPFPHHRHQAVIQDCGTCHEVFPQQADAILKLKNEGTMAGKQVMNKLCIKCHRAEQRAGKAAGPVLCSECHVKE
jgi:cytochrome c-type protein NrfB